MKPAPENKETQNVKSVETEKKTEAAQKSEKDEKAQYVKIFGYKLDIFILLVSITLCFTGAVLFINSVVNSGEIKTIVYYKASPKTSSTYYASTESEYKETMDDEITGPININTADVDELTKLDGIGPSKAKAIIAYREENGDFESVEDLLKVSGIGKKTFEAIEDDIVV